MKKIISFLDRLLDKGLLLFCLLCFMTGLYGLYDSYRIYIRTADDSLLYFKPGYETADEPEKKIQGNLAAWLTLDEAGIDCPVMYGKNNTEYLSRDPYGEYSLAGSIFLDARNSPDFTDRYSLIYGHHMEGGLMFGPLDKYLDKAWFSSHMEGTLTVGKKVYPLRVYAVVEADAAAEEIFSPTEQKPKKTFRYVKKKALYYRADLEPDLKKGERILGLSTCKRPDTTERVVVFCAY